MTDQPRQIQDVNIRSTIPLTSPNALISTYPLTDQLAEFVYESRETVKAILRGEDRRVIAVVGPCSIHQRKSGIEFAERLAPLAKQLSDRILVVMRVYFEKPRTTVGWKGLINDPYLNGTFDMSEGLRLAREILIDINNLGLPTATELLEPITPQYIADLISIGSIGARTTESPTHRQMASGLSMPVGFKNSTEGSLEVAINAMKAARTEHTFLGINHEGHTCMMNTQGNEMGHLILRGGRMGPNYDAESIAKANRMLEDADLPHRLVVDCSHANSNKDYTKQSIAWNDVIAQRAAGNDSIVGLMLESNLNAGNQKLTDDLSKLEYGVSITDGCIEFDEMADLLQSAYETLEATTAAVG